jgi:hypothetical protein
MNMSDGKPIKKQERKKLLRELEQYRKKLARVISKRKKVSKCHYCWGNVIVWAIKQVHKYRKLFKFK